MMISRLGSRCLLLLSAFCCQACEDLSPLPFTPADAASLDVSQPDSSSAAECKACATAEGGICRSSYDICAADALCKIVFDCIIEKDCLRQINPTNPSGGSLPRCATDCIDDANTSINNVIVPALEFFTCVADPTKCRMVCFTQ